MSTVILTCTNCHVLFNKCKHEIKRRKAKPNCSLDKWFCSRSCSVRYSNKHRDYRPQGPKNYGNKHNQKWDPELSWYISRITKDARQHFKSIHTKQELHDHLKSIWTGFCNISQVPIYRKTIHSKKHEDVFSVASIDRIDSNLPYQVGNLQWVSLGLNLAKLDSDNDTFIDNLKRFVTICNVHR